MERNEGRIKRASYLGKNKMFLMLIGVIMETMPRRLVAMLRYLRTTDNIPLMRVWRINSIVRSLTFDCRCIRKETESDTGTEADQTGQPRLPVAFASITSMKTSVQM